MKIKDILAEIEPAEAEQILDVIQAKYEEILLSNSHNDLLLSGITILSNAIDICKKTGKIPERVYASETYICMVIDTDRTFVQVIDVVINGVHFKREWKLGSTETYKCNCQCHDEDKNLSENIADKETLIDALSKAINDEDMLVDLLGSLKLSDFLKLKGLISSLCRTMDN